MPESNIFHSSLQFSSKKLILFASCIIFMEFQQYITVIWKEKYKNIKDSVPP